MDRTHRLTGDAGIQTAGGIADRDTVIWPEPVLWDDDDVVLGCSAPAALVPRALGRRGDLTGDALRLMGHGRRPAPVRQRRALSRAARSAAAAAP